MVTSDVSASPSLDQGCWVYRCTNDYETCCPVVRTTPRADWTVSAWEGSCPQARE
jgi:hypothetical protein